MSVYDNLVETMIRRTDPLKDHAPAPTIFNLDKIQYVFQPRPELTGDTEASVCVVISQEHRDYLLKDSRCQANFRAYVPKEQAPEDVQRQAEFEAFCNLRKSMTAEEIAAMVLAGQAVEELGNKTPPEQAKAPQAITGVEGIAGIGGRKAKKATEAPKPAEITTASDFAPPVQGKTDNKLDLSEEF
jgi:hypothetical protein